MKFSWVERRAPNSNEAGSMPAIPANLLEGDYNVHARVERFTPRRDEKVIGANTTPTTSSGIKITLTNIEKNTNQLLKLVLFVNKKNL